MRFNERSVVVLIAAGLVVAIAVVLVLTRGSDDSGSNDDFSSSARVAGNAAASLEGGPDEILMLSGTTLVRRDVEAQTEETIDDIPSPSVHAAPGSTWLAYVTSKQASADDDFATEPVLHLYDTETKEKSGYGAGVAPVWNPSGTHVAFLRPIEPRDCTGEQCPGENQIGVVEAATGRESLLLDPGRYTILGWAGEWVLVSDFENPTSVISVSLGDERATLDMPPSQFWEASPDGAWVIKTNAKKTEFVAIADGELGDERIPVELGRHELLEGAWAHDSSRVAAVTSLPSAIAKGKGKKNRLVEQEPTTQIVSFSPDDPEPVLVDRTYGAAGTVLWSVENDAIVFASLLDPRKALFQARLCPIGNSEECRIVTSWTEGVALLRAE